MDEQIKQQSQQSQQSQQKHEDKEIIKIKFIKSKKVEIENVFFQVKESENNDKVYKLEGLYSHVKAENKTSSYCEGIAVLLTHPHPMLGGSLRNNVTLGVSEYITTYLQIPTLCFNFRGVGKSQGKGSWFGSHEREDTLAAVEYLLSKPNINSVIIVGYSYGSVIGSSIADQHPSIKAFSSISYPFGPLTLMLLGSLLKFTLNSPKPKLFLTGDSDNFTSISTFKKRMNEFKEPSNLETKIFEGVDHFYGGNEKNLAQEISKWIYKISLE